MLPRLDARPQAPRESPALPSHRAAARRRAAAAVLAVLVGLGGLVRRRGGAALQGVHLLLEPQQQLAALRGPSLRDGRQPAGRALLLLEPSGAPLAHGGGGGLLQPPHLSAQPGQPQGRERHARLRVGRDVEPLRVRTHAVLQAVGRPRGQLADGLEQLALLQVLLVAVVVHHVPQRGLVRVERQVASDHGLARASPVKMQADAAADVWPLLPPLVRHRRHLAVDGEVLEHAAPLGVEHALEAELVVTALVQRAEQRHGLLAAAV
eukprot:scaffold37479_cov57-Phaeocystis_antarctica.AAC.1